jgi:hypothetical protein
VISRNRCSRLCLTGSSRFTPIPALTSVALSRAVAWPTSPACGESTARSPSSECRTAAISSLPSSSPSARSGSSTPRISSLGAPPPASSATGPCVTTLPRSTIAAASQVFSTSSSRCEEMNTVRPSCSTIARIIWRNSWMPPGSSPLVGSSRISSSGSASRQRATPSRWRMPIEYFPTRSSPRAVRPTRASAGSIRERTSGPRAAATTRRFSRPLRCM